MNIPVGRLFLRRLKNTPEVRCLAISISVTSPAASFLDFSWLSPCSVSCPYSPQNFEKKLKGCFLSYGQKNKTSSMWFWSLDSCCGAKDVSTAHVSGEGVSSSTVSPEETWKRDSLGSLAGCARCQPTVSLPSTPALVHSFGPLVFSDLILVIKEVFHEHQR